jgi:hypothetical protein
MAEARPRRAPLVALLPRPRRSNGQRMVRHGPGSTLRFRLVQRTHQHRRPLQGPSRPRPAGAGVCCVDRLRGRRRPAEGRTGGPAYRQGAEGRSDSAAHARAGAASPALCQELCPEDRPAAAPGKPRTAFIRGPLVPQIPLPRGFTDPMAAVQAINQDINRLAMFTGGQGGEVAREKIRNLEWQRDQILKQSAPPMMHSGETAVDPRTGQPIYQATGLGAFSPAQSIRLRKPITKAENCRRT